MKKSTKLLSIILAVIMILSSLTVGAFAAKTAYQTKDNLESLGAYNNYGTVTRLTTEERTSIAFDALDMLLAKANINMGTVFDAMGFTIIINFTSIDNICVSLDSFYEVLEDGGFMAGLAMAFMDFGILESVDLSPWQTGMTRANQAQLTIVTKLLQTLAKNSGVVNTVLTSGIDIGQIASIAHLNLKPISDLVTDLPTLIKNLVYPLFSRPDEKSTDRNKLYNKTVGVETAIDDFVKGLFTKPMNWTSYRVDASGNDLGYTTALPKDTDSDKSTRYFEISPDKSTITQYDFKYKADSILKADPEQGTWVETVTYTKSDTEEFGNPGVYLYNAPEGYEGDQTLKWYTAGNDGIWLPKLKEAMDSDAFTFSLNGTDSVLSLLYKFAPYIFREMAPVVLNGSVKKLVAELFDVKFTKLGNKGEFVAPESDTFFTEEQGEYLWEWSNYKVINGVPYYRFQDEFFVGEIPANISSYYYMFDWNYTITGDFVDEFIPAGSLGTSSSTRILTNLNSFVKKAIDTIILPTWTVNGTTYNRNTVFAWSTTNGNGDLLDNIKNVARNVVNIAPVEIFGDYYSEAQFYTAMMTGTLSQAVNGAICEGVKLLMKQIEFPDNIVNQNMLAIGAVVVRELCSQLMPSYNFDALIYSDYGDAAGHDRAVLEGKDKEYWLNVCLTMGLDLGLYYLRNLADLGEDTNYDYYKVMKNLGALPSNDAEAMTYTADFDVSKWTYKVDWIADWALATEEWCWRMSYAINVTGATTLTTYQDPWAKINSVLLAILPLDKLLNTSGATSSTFLEKVLRDKFVYAIADLDLPKLVSLFDIPTGTDCYFTSSNILNQAVKLIVYILDGILNKTYGGELLSKSTFTSLSAFLNHTNLKAVVVALVGKLNTFVYTNKLIDIVMPFVNMFLGWKTDPQEYKDPTIGFTNSGGDTYLHKDATNYITFTNNSAGMLLRHRSPDNLKYKYDSPYTIVVDSITFDTTQMSLKTALSGTNNRVAPYETKSYELKVTGTDAVAKATVTYHFLGKTDTTTQMGSQQTVVAYGYMTNVWDQENEQEGDADIKYWNRDKYKKYEFTKDIYGAVTEYKGSVSYKGSTLGIGDPSSVSFNSMTADTAPQGIAGTYFQAITSRAESGFPDKLYKKPTGSQVSAGGGKLWKAKSGVTADTNFPYGVYDMGQMAVKYNNKSGTWVVDFIYYNDFEIGNVKSEYVGKQIKSSDVSSAGQTAFTQYETALKAVVKWADYPKTTTYVTTVQGNIEAAIDNLEAKYEALEPYLTTATVDYEAQLQAKLDQCEDRDRDYDFQDYKLFEYFKYENQRTEIRNMIKAYQEPVAPTQYIENEDVSYENIQAAISGASANVATGINATLVDPTTEAVDAYNEAMANFKDPTYSDLQVADIMQKLPYYYSFMKLNPRATYYKQFLAKEIAYANAQYPTSDAALYSPDSWAEFQTCLTKATTVNNDSAAIHSEIFEAKYNLMVAMRDLNKVEHSMKDDGNNYLAEIQGYIDNANVILDHLEYYTVVPGMTTAEALGQLVRALGVNYTDVNGNDAILYNHSALTFTTYDRVNTSKNKLAVDAAADKLKAAIDNFLCDVIEQNGDGYVNTVVPQIKLVAGIQPGTILTVADLLDHIRVKTGVSGVTLETLASAANAFGTGAKVNANATGVGTLATYLVVIYGDVNGDGAIDAFDAYDSDKALAGTATFTGAYATAADAVDDDEFNATDYSTILQASVGNATIEQVR